MSKLDITKVKVYAVEYAGTMFIQDEPFYGAINLLDFDVVGKKQAEANANLYVDAHNVAIDSGKTPSELLEANKELLEALKEFVSLSEDSDMRPEDECIELYYKYTKLIKKHEQ